MYPYRWRPNNISGYVDGALAKYIDKPCRIVGNDTFIYDNYRVAVTVEFEDGFRQLMWKDHLIRDDHADWMDILRGKQNA